MGVGDAARRLERGPRPLASVGGEGAGVGGEAMRRVRLLGVEPEGGIPIDCGPHESIEGRREIDVNCEQGALPLVGNGVRLSEEVPPEVGRPGVDAATLCWQGVLWKEWPKVRTQVSVVHGGEARSEMNRAVNERRVGVRTLWQGDHHNAFPTYGFRAVVDDLRQQEVDAFAPKLSPQNWRLPPRVGRFARDLIGAIPIQGGRHHKVGPSLPRARAVSCEVGRGHRGGTP